jgi:MoxR-like ATPase
MDITLLFRKKTPLSDEGLPWLRGAFEHEFTARRNSSGRAVLSAVLVRSLLACLDGAVQYAEANAGGDIVARVRSSASPSSHAICALKGNNFCIPHGEAQKITYHAGVLSILRALHHPTQATDFWDAYQALQSAYILHGKAPDIQEYLCRACDELYYHMRYANLDPQPENDLLSPATITSNAGVESGWEAMALDLSPLTDPAALQRLRGQAPAMPAPEPVHPVAQTGLDDAGDGFVGWQIAALSEAIAAGEHTLLAGPTGSGKTACLFQVAAASPYTVVTIEGKEGLTDLDFLGAILPQEDGSRRWVDGPLLRALRLAHSDPVLLFFDELNRTHHRHLNLLLTLLNPKPGDFCRQAGLQVAGDGPYYVLETPMTSEIVCCPAQHLRIVAAGNFGRAYAVYDLDPALRRRFDTVLEFDYLESAQELALVQRRTGLVGKVAQALVQVSQETRRLMGNGEMPGCIDTGSLLNWAGKCVRSNAHSVESVMQAAALTWADTVCGRDHVGKVNAGNFKAIQDYLGSLGILPNGSSA